MDFRCRRSEKRKRGGKGKKVPLSLDLGVIQEYFFVEMNGQVHKGTPNHQKKSCVDVKTGGQIAVNQFCPSV